MQRSLATQMTVFMVVFAIMLFGGASLRQFMATMLVGLISGAYSTVFVAVSMMVGWDEGSWFGKRSPEKVTGTVVTA
jgi:preprotein translocase subunit SecF